MRKMEKLDMTLCHDGTQYYLPLR